MLIPLIVPFSVVEIIHVPIPVVPETKIDPPAGFVDNLKPLVSSAADAVHVPIPTLPPTMIILSCGVDVPTPTFP